MRPALQFKDKITLMKNWKNSTHLLLNDKNEIILSLIFQSETCSAPILFLYFIWVLNHLKEHVRLLCIFAVFSLNHFKKFKLIYFIAFKMFPWQNDVLEIKKNPYIYIQNQIDIFHHRKIWSKPLCIRSENFIRIEQAFYVNWCALF